MADAELAAARLEFADLTVFIEDAALIGSAGQGVMSLDEGRHRFKHRIRTRLVILEGHLQ